MDAICDAVTCEILFSRPSDIPSSPGEYISNLEPQLESVHWLSTESINFFSDRVKTYYNISVTVEFLKEGNQIRVYNTTLRKGLFLILPQNWEYIIQY